MPHAVTKGIGLQALILCGPGSSFPTFTANPDENPKALLPIANRPMVWYPLDFCSRAGISEVTLICPPSAAETIDAALKTNPFLTSLPAPAVLAPKDLDQTTGTAAILRLPEVRAVVTADFVVLPCDLVCELGGERLLQAWMAKAASLADLLEESELGYEYASSGGGGIGSGGGTRIPGESVSDVRKAAVAATDGYGHTAAHSGGLGVWYDTRTGIPPVKGEETDFVATVPLADTASAPPSSTRSSSSTSSLLPYLERVVTAMPTDSLNDLAEEKSGYPVRHGLLRQHRRVRMRTTHRDAHIYVFPQWVMDFVAANAHMDSIGEDVVGWWAKAEWQRALPEKLGMDKVLQGYGAAWRANSHNHHNQADHRRRRAGDHGGSGDSNEGDAGDDGESSSRATGKPREGHPIEATGDDAEDATPHYEAGAILTAAPPEQSADPPAADQPTPDSEKDAAGEKKTPPLRRQPVPPLLAYVHPSATATEPAAATAPPPPLPLIRRVDTAPLLLAVSLQLAKLPSLEEAAAAAGVALDSATLNVAATPASLSLPASAAVSPFSHARKVAYPEGVKPRTTVTRQDSLVAENVTVEEKVSIRECVVGANCQIGEGAKLHQCLLMEGVVVGKGCRLTRCILGRRSEVGAQSVLTDCQVQENLLVEPKTEEKDNNFMSSEGLEATAEEMDAAMDDADDFAVGGV